MPRAMAVLFAAVLALAVPAPAASATRLMSTKAGDSLYVEYDTLPNDQPGTHDTLDIILGHSTWTENGIVTYDWYNFELYRGHVTWDADFNTLPGGWAGGYFSPATVAPVWFGPRTVVGTRTLTWQCLYGACPTMPATIDVMVTATAVGPPQTQTVTGAGPSGPTTGVSQVYDATVSVDTGGAIALPPLVSWSTLSHGQSRTIEP